MFEKPNNRERCNAFASNILNKRNFFSWAVLKYCWYLNLFISAGYICRPHTCVCILSLLLWTHKSESRLASKESRKWLELEELILSCTEYNLMEPCTFISVCEKRTTLQIRLGWLICLPAHRCTHKRKRCYCSAVCMMKKIYTHPFIEGLR